MALTMYSMFSILELNEATFYRVGHPQRVRTHYVSHCHHKHTSLICAHDFGAHIFGYVFDTMFSTLRFLTVTPTMPTKLHSAIKPSELLHMRVMAYLRFSSA